MSMRLFACSVTVFIMFALTFAVSRAAAQTPINAPGAMQPSTGTGVLHIMPMYRREGSDPRGGQESADNYVAVLQAAYGITSTIGIQFDVPMVYQSVSMRDGSSDDDFGIADSTVLVKWRVYQDDPAPAETTRFSLIGGLQIPGDSDYTWDASVDAWDPIIGFVFSTVRGRHGLNADALWEFYTGNDRDEGASDSLRYDASYLFRLAPAEYAADTGGAWYAVIELNGFYDANGDNELFLSPGVMYEARAFTLDATVMIPVWQDLDYRVETEIAVACGLRISF
jgi:hypothetical protein